MNFQELPPPDYRRLSDLQSGIDDWYSPSSMRAYADAAAAAERERCKARALEVIGWHRNSYNGAQIDSVLEELRKAL